MRRSEIVNLRQDNISLAAETIEVISWQSFRTKAGKRRIIPMNSTSKAILQAQPRGLDGYVFHDDAGGRLLPDRISREFHQALSAAQKAGEISTEKRLHFHSLRHSFATWLLEHGEENTHVRDLLGHYSVKTTQIYVHLPKEALRRTVEQATVPFPKMRLVK